MIRVDYVFGLRDTRPNLTGYYLDDFFRFAYFEVDKWNSETMPAPGLLSLAAMKQLHEETIAYKRRLDLAIVLYTSQLCPGIKPVMKYVDVVSLCSGCGAGKASRRGERREKGAVWATKEFDNGEEYVGLLAGGARFSQE